MRGGGQSLPPCTFILGQLFPLSLALISHPSWVLSIPPGSSSYPPFLAPSPQPPEVLRWGGWLCSLIFSTRLPPDRLAVLSSPVPVSLASICSSPFLGSSPIPWLHTRLREGLHLTNHVPSLSLLSPPVSPSFSQRSGSLHLVYSLSFGFLSPLMFGSLSPSISEFLSPSLSGVSVLFPLFSLGLCPSLFLGLCPSFCISGPFYFSFCPPPISVALLLGVFAHLSQGTFLSQQPLSGCEAALQIPYPSSQTQSWFQNGRGREPRWGLSQSPYQGHLSLARTPPATPPSLPPS